MINVYWPYSHVNGISDQLWVLKKIFDQFDLPFIISKNLDPIAVNVVPENLTREITDNILNFYKIHCRKVYVLATEFIDIRNGKILVNNQSIDLASTIFAERISNLFKVKSAVDGVLSICNQPNLDSYQKLLDCGVYELGLPNFDCEISPLGNQYDFYFSGSLTLNRKDVLQDISRDFRVLKQHGFVDEKTRAHELMKCDFNLNIVQDLNWKWLSTMRVLFGLRYGKLTVQPTSVPITALSDFVFHMKDFSDRESLLDFHSNFIGKKIKLQALDSNWAIEKNRFLSRIAQLYYI